MGYPIFSKQNDLLLVSLPLYRTKIAGNFIDLYLPRYMVRSVFPFTTVVCFEDLLYCSRYQEKDFGTPVASFPLAAYKETSFINDSIHLVQKGDQVLQEFESSKKVSQDSLDDYQRAVSALVHPALLKFYQDEIKF